MKIGSFIPKDIGLIVFIAITMGIFIGLYKFFEQSEKASWNAATRGELVKE